MPEHIPCSHDSADADGLRPDAFLEDAMHRWGDTVLRLALSQLRDASDAEDVFQDVFVRLLKDRTAFNDDEHLKAWLLRVTINRCRDIGRSGWKRRNEPLAERHAALAVEAPDLLESDIWNAIGALPPDLRAVVHGRAPALRGGLFHRRGGRPRGMPPFHRAHAPAPRPQAPEGRPRDRGSRRPPCALPTGGRIARGRRLRFFAPRKQRVCEPPARGQSLRLYAPRNHRFPVFRKGGRP